jgi:hypothetical protein
MTKSLNKKQIQKNYPLEHGLGCSVDKREIGVPFAVGVTVKCSGGHWNPLNFLLEGYRMFLSSGVKRPEYELTTRVHMVHK